MKIEYLTDTAKSLRCDAFVDEGAYEPLIGYIILEQSQAVVDMLGHCLIHVKRMDLK